MRNFSVDLPYPSLDEVKPNKNDLLIILNDYSGLISELSAVTQYIYHKQNFDAKNLANVGASLLQIAIVEMRHLNIFGEMITKLGGNPKFVYKKGNDFNFWCANMIDCKTKVIEMLESDLKLELETIENYKKHAIMVSQEEISEMLLRIVKDEELHVKILLDLIEELNAV